MFCPQSLQVIKQMLGAVKLSATDKDIVAAASAFAKLREELEAAIKADQAAALAKIDEIAPKDPNADL